MTGDTLADAAIINMILGFLIPPIVSFLRGRRTPVELIGLIVFGVVLVFTAITMFLQDKFLPAVEYHGRDLIRYYIVNFGMLFATAIVSYRGWWKTVGSDVTEKLEGVGPSPGDPK